MSDGHRRRHPTSEILLTESRVESLSERTRTRLREGSKRIDEMQAEISNLKWTVKQYDQNARDAYRERNAMREELDRVKAMLPKAPERLYEKPMTGEQALLGEG